MSDPLIDACVMECYFRDHMAERNLLFHDIVAEVLKGICATASLERATKVSYTNF
jgi:hypothetical protein